MILSLFLFRYNLASRFYSFANPPSLFSFCGHNVCCLFHLIDFLLRTFFFSIQVYFSKESFSPFLVSRCHHCRFECQNFFLWSKLSDFFIWKIQTFFTLLKSRTKMECQNGINSKICQEFHFHSFLLISRLSFKRLTAIVEVMTKNSHSLDHILERKFQLYSN